MSEETKAETRRVVLEQHRTVRLPAGDVDLKKVAEAIGVPVKALVVADTWTVVGEFEGASKANAIEAHAGKPNTADAKPGTYKAPTVSAFGGGLIYEAPPEPLVARRELED